MNDDHGGGDDDDDSCGDGSSSGGYNDGDDDHREEFVSWSKIYKYAGYLKEKLGLETMMDRTTSWPSA